MKKIITIALITAFIIPVSVGAAGWGATITCIPSTKPNSNCEDKYDMFRRIYDLEVQVEQLQSKLNSQTVATTPSTQIITQTDNSRIEAVEKRVGVIETTLNFIQTNVMQILTSIVSFLKTK